MSFEIREAGELAFTVSEREKKMLEYLQRELGIHSEVEILRFCLTDMFKYFKESELEMKREYGDNIGS